MLALARRLALYLLQAAGSAARSHAPPDNLLRPSWPDGSPRTVPAQSNAAQIAAQRSQPEAVRSAALAAHALFQGLAGGGPRRQYGWLEPNTAHRSPPP